MRLHVSIDMYRLQHSSCSPIKPKVAFVPHPIYCLFGVRFQLSAIFKSNILLCGHNVTVAGVTSNRCEEEI